MPHFAYGFVFTDFNNMQYGYKESVPDLSDLIDHVSRLAEWKGPVTENFEENLHCNPQFSVLECKS